MVVVESVVPRFSLRRVDVPTWHLSRELAEFQKDVSIIIPAYNEEIAIMTVVADVKRRCRQSDWRYEIIVVDDASKDLNRCSLPRPTGVKVISHPTNVGYGGALRTGHRSLPTYSWIATIDADCSYPPDEF